MDYSNKTREELILICKENNIKGYSGKKKDDIIKLLSKKVSEKNEIIEEHPVTIDTDKLKMIDLFAGTGAFTLAFQGTNEVNVVFANDMVEHSKNIYDENFNHELTLKNLNEIDVEDIPKHDILTGGFPCFIEGTKVLTYGGYKNIEDVLLDDKLLTHTGEFQSILNLQKKIYNGDLYEIDIKYHSNTINCTSEHPFYIREKKREWDSKLNIYIYTFNKPIWKKAIELTKNDYIGMVINNKNIIPEFTFEKEVIKFDKYEEWYMMGYMLGETKEVFSIIHKKIIYIFGKYAREKIIPEWVQDAPIEFIQEFINGYNKSNSIYNTPTLSYNLIHGLQRLYLKLRNSTLKITSFIEENYAWFKPFKITKKNIVNTFVYNFEVENDNSYIVENAIVHNCQPFSITGLQEGFKDERSNVFWKILSIIDYHKPKCVILENVKNILSHDENKTFNIIKSNLESRGYYICYKVLNTADITGIPHHRERIYIVCLKSKNIFDKFSLEFPKIEKKEISEFLETNIPSKYYYTEKSSIWNMLKSNVFKKDTIYQYRRVYVRENKSCECPTLTANMGTGGHNVPIIIDSEGVRKLTPRECFNFQGFPESYKLPKLSDTNLYKLAGNAVSVPVVILIANRIIPLLLGE